LAELRAGVERRAEVVDRNEAAEKAEGCDGKGHLGLVVAIFEEVGLGGMKALGEFLVGMSLQGKGSPHGQHFRKEGQVTIAAAWERLFERGRYHGREALTEGGGAAICQLGFQLRVGTRPELRERALGLSSAAVAFPQARHLARALLAPTVLLHSHL
jgi:hypothetical protein